MPRFIAFGRGKCIPLTPENQTADVPQEISNTGRIVVNKCIYKIDKRENLAQAEKDFLNQHVMDRGSKIIERKKKGRLYSLGGNEPQRKAYRGRLDRLKTVGTFDLGTEMCVLSEVAKNLNKQIILGEVGLINPFNQCHQGINIASMTSSATFSVQNSKRSTPEIRKRNLNADIQYDALSGRSPSLETKSNIEFKTQHSADDCIQKNTWINVSDRKARSLSTSSYLDQDHLEPPFEQFVNIKVNDIMQEFNITKGSPLSKSTQLYMDKYSKDHVSSSEILHKNEDSQIVSLKNRKPMLRKSQRIIRTDSEILSEDIFVDKNEIISRNNSEVQVHVSSEMGNDIKNNDLSKEKFHFINSENDRNSSITSSVFSRKNSSDLDDAYFPKIMQKSTDDSSKNPSTDEIDAVFSDSTTDLERLEKEYKELIKSNLQREYKSDGDALDEVGIKRSEFGKWKNQSLEHEFEFSNQELGNINGCQTLSSYSNETSGDVKDLSRICSPESCKNGAYSDSGLGKLDNKQSTYSKMRSRVYSSSRLGETPKEKERLHQIAPNESNNSTSQPTHENLCTKPKSSSRPSVLELKHVSDTKHNTENIKSSLFEKPFGKFRKVNKLLKCKRFSASTLNDRKKSDENNGPNYTDHQSVSKESLKNNNNLEKRKAIHLSKLSLFSQKYGKPSIFCTRKLGMFSNSSRSNNELFSKSGSKTKLSEVSKSSTEISKSKGSLSQLGNRKSSKNKKNNNSACANLEQICHSPLSEEFYNKTGSVRLSAVELYEKFCSEEFAGLYKHEQRYDEGKEGSCLSQHEYRLGKKGLRVIGRYNKNMMLFKQKSEPKFNFRPNTSNDYYQEEEEENYFNKAGKCTYEYYNEQDENCDEYEDEDGEEVGCEYYDDGGDYYEGESNLGEPISDSQFIDRASSVHNIVKQHPDKNYLFENISHEMEVDKKILEANAGGESDVDEIYLMPEEIKCMDYKKYGFDSNKQLMLEQPLEPKIYDKKINLDYLSTSDETSLIKDDKVMKSFKSINDQKEGDILTIYKIVSKDKIEAGLEVSQKPKNVLVLEKCEGLQPPKLDYVKLTKSDAVIEPGTNNAELNYIERAESLELLSISSETVRTHSTLTEYAFETVRNLNMDSCSTSKLSLSLKSEVFDDFAITPNDFKTIQNCEFEDFTLTPDGSLSETYQKFSPLKNYEHEKTDSLQDDESRNRAITIVDRFLMNERMNQSLKENEYYKQNTDQHKEVIEAEKTDQSSLVEKFEESGQSQQSRSNTDTTNEYTIIDLYDDDDEHTISLFTSELTKEFDRLFSKAEEFVQNSCSCTTEHNPVKPDMPSRYSMQQLEPYYIADLDERPEEKSRDDYGNVIDNLDFPTAKYIKKSKLKKNRSKSLNNLNRKTKCFPL